MSSVVLLTHTNGVVPLKKEEKKTDSDILVFIFKRDYLTA